MDFFIKFVGDNSRFINALVGDKTGRTISLRTGQGVKKSLNLNISDREAVDITHTAMLAGGLLLCSKNTTTKNIGLGIGATLFLAYHAGK